MFIYFKLFKESLLFALHALVVNKLRTFLSLLGITIGIFAIISVFTVVDSLEQNIRKSVASLGENVIFVQKWPWEFGEDYPWWKYINRPVPKPNELPEIIKRVQGAQCAAFVATANKTVKYKNNSVENTEIKCVTHLFEQVKTFQIVDQTFTSPTVNFFLEKTLSTILKHIFDLQNIFKTVIFKKKKS